MRGPVLIAPLLAFTLCSLANAQFVDETRHRQALERYRAGQQFLYAEAWDKAAAEFAAAIGLDPLLTLAHYGLGQAQMGLENYPQAVQAFLGCRQAFADIAALGQSEEIDTDRRRDDELRELRDSIRLIQSGQIKVASPNLLVVRLESRVRDLERARQRGLEGHVDPPAEVSLALGSAYFRSGSLEDAEREWQAALAVNPKFGEAHNNIAVLYLLTGRPREAQEAVRQAERTGYRVNPGLKEDIKTALEGR